MPEFELGGGHDGVGVDDLGGVEAADAAGSFDFTRETNAVFVVVGVFGQDDFDHYRSPSRGAGEEYLPHIRFVCLVMTEAYLRARFDDVRRYANVVENRISDGLCLEALIRDNAVNLARCREHGCEVLLIDGEYQVELPN